ncbi:MmgE/PrpD family protein [Arthrobacter celericrescens]|uniref:MmgE/PrpD family protein n=1 Tax=Arthrobacter celericrescens TaxID=2320851 RepID=UPI000EA026FC|nr:MmgE/PrpD family protein [Arthrobacter celericrescens]
MTTAARTQAPPLAVRLGDWVAGMASQPLSPGQARKASDHLLDTLGAMVAGQDEPAAQAARKVFRRPGPVPLAGVAGLWHHGATVDPLDAAFVNAVAAHCLEIDDTEGCDHSGAVVVPVLLSLLPAGDTPDGGARPGGRLLPALVAGYEVGRRVQLALGGYERHNARGWHSTATCGVFAAAAAASVMLGLDGRQSASALGIAASSSAGSWAFSADGSMTKQFHPGKAARAGLEAALLAQAGASGPQQVFEPVWGGFFATHGGPDGAGSGKVEPGLLVEGLGSVWHFEHSAIKPYASCRSAHSAIDAFLDILAAEGLEPADIRAVRVHVNDFLRPMICPPAPADAAQSRMSLSVSLALLCEGRELMPEDFRHFDSPAILEQLARIEVVRDPEGGREPLVEVVTDSGTFASRVEHARGGARHPLSPAEVEGKFRRLTADRLDVAQQAEWIAFARDLLAF